MADLDFIEVSRKAHELSQQHGSNAHKYAAKLAAEALAENQVEEHKFWKAVAAALISRDTTG